MTRGSLVQRPMLRGASLGLAAAALFGISAPFAKLLLPGSSPVMLAGLLYLGAGLGLTLASVLRSTRRNQEARLRSGDFRWLAAIVLLGGIIGPILMLYGLGRVSGVVGSLLLNLEAPFTVILAVVFFREHVAWRSVVATVFVVCGAAVLGFQPGAVEADWIGTLAIAAACASWGLDNNFSQRLSMRDPLAVVRVKALGAGVCSLAVGLVSGEPLPGPALVAPALLLGAMSYGLSIVLDMYALRILGAAREATFFATAPFIGAVAALPILGERLGRADLIAGGLMVAGVLLLLRERHGHLHGHEELEHDHLHVHDEHHQHAHQHPPSEPHSHPHRHPPITHDHPHVPDIHHRHRH